MEITFWNTWEDIVDIFHRINLHDATNLINKADKGCELDRNDKHRLTLMVHNIKHDYDETGKENMLKVLKQPISRLGQFCKSATTLLRLKYLF